MTRKFLSLLCVAALAACSKEPVADQGASAASAAASAVQAAGEGVTVKTVRGDVVVPAVPERVAVFDWGMLDTLNKLGVKVGASTDKTRVDYLDAAIKDAKQVGTLFEPDYEALNAYKPQLIVTGSRTAKAYDQLSKIAPTIEMTADTTNMRASAEERIDSFAKIFHKEAEAKALKEELDKSFAETKAAAAGKGNGLVVLVSGGKLSAFGQNSRFGWIHKDVGVPTVDADIKEGGHGQPISFEYIKQRNPDWLFVLDRTAAIGEKGDAAKDILNNPLVAQTTAWKKGQVVYLIPANYLAAGGAQQLLDTNKQLRDAFNQAK